jgi:hypothetical protein
MREMRFPYSVVAGTTTDTAGGRQALFTSFHFAKQHCLLQRAPEPLVRADRFAPVFRDGGKPMQHRFKGRCAPETLNLFAVIALMAVFAAGLFCAGDSFREPQRTTHLAVPNLNP